MVYAEDGKTLAVIKGSNSIADTQLMSASPELLEACKEAEDRLFAIGLEQDRAILRKLQNAINKAEGN